MSYSVRPAPQTSLAVHVFRVARIGTSAPVEAPCGHRVAAPVGADPGVEIAKAEPFDVPVDEKDVDPDPRSERVGRRVPERRRRVTVRDVRGPAAVAEPRDEVVG